ncbi:MAG: hypothetical protein PHF00_05630 [Elusimicrobia bacterium]|nr:hypothetical protein [Elusimicrobiota bacterium]
MKRTMILMFAAGMAATALPVRAQAPTPPKGKPAAEEAAPKPRRGPPTTEKILERLTKRLELNSEQQTKVKAILDRSRPEMEKLRTQMQDLRDRMHKEMFRTREDIRETLTLDQKQKFDEEGPRLMMGGRGMGPGMMRGEGPGMCPAGEDCPMMKHRMGPDEGEDAPPDEK